jgi:multicomponent Na+:H+ antiporter subunit B
VSPAVRRVLFAIALVGFSVVLVRGMVAMPDAGSAADAYRTAVVTTAVEQIGAANTVSAVLFDLRASDTLGEALALFAAAAGLQLLLRQLRDDEHEIDARDAASDRPEPVTTDAVRVVALGLVGPVVALSIYIAVRGHVTVGAGFQAGALAATAVVLIYLAGRYRAMHRVVPERVLDVGEAAGAGGAAALGLAGLVVTGALFTNLAGAGAFGTLASGGTMVVLSLLIAIEAAAATMLIVTEFQHQTFELRPGPD